MGKEGRDRSPYTVGTVHTYSLMSKSENLHAMLSGYPYAQPIGNSFCVPFSSSACKRLNAKPVFLPLHRIQSLK
jgi:hypothetical protein